jgi:hypothetical protein
MLAIGSNEVGERFVFRYIKARVNTNAIDRDGFVLRLSG